MIQDALRAFREMFTPAFRRVMILSVLGSLGLLIVLGVLLQWAVGAIPTFETAWLNTLVDWVARFIAVIILIPLVMPVAVLIAGTFLESIAAKVEEERYPQDPKGRDLPLLASIALSLKFFLIVIGLNLIALPLYLVPGINLILFWVLNGYLLGREYFDLVAMRHHPTPDAVRLRKKHSFRVFLTGVAVALFATIPILNLLTCLFGTALFVHTYKRLNDRQSIPHV